MNPSKILLFGEYSILAGSNALAIPFEQYGGFFAFLDARATNENIGSNRQLKFLLEYLIEKSGSEKIVDLSRLKTDIEKGLYFSSNIPLKYGLGSSGALSAELFHKYAVTKPEGIAGIKTKLAAIESFFHGQSSGIDALVSYLNQPVLLNNGKFTIIENSIFSNLEQLGLFLVDSGTPSATKGIVADFLYRFRSDNTFQQFMEHNYNPTINAVINTVVKNNRVQFFEFMHDLSAMQLNHFSHLFLHPYSAISNDGLQQNIFYLKVCGSGGGGFLLGFAKNKNETELYFSKRNLKFQWYKKPKNILP